ncbi:MAG: MGH1-like glycoside hydrolase domain-containing protein [Isosphaeraceae bacterium]
MRSLVGLVPLFAVERLEVSWIAPFSDFRRCLDWFLTHRRDLVEDVVHTIDRGGDVTHVLTIVNRPQLERILERLWDPAEFLSDYGIRSLSLAHAAQPFVFDGQSVGYEPAEAVSKMKGGNSNWRGPIWFPTCFLLIESLRKLAKAFGPDFAVAAAGSGGQPITAGEMARSIAERLIHIVARDPISGRRAVFAGQRAFEEDPNWNDLVLFYEYFHGDTGAGLGASHQTGWTALLASIIDEWRSH